MKRLTIGMLITAVMGCSNTTPVAPVATNTPPAAIATATPQAGLSVEDIILSEARSWTKTEDIWSRVHPECKKALSDKHKTTALRGLSGVLAISKGGPQIVDAFSATPSPAHIYPVQPTHVVRNGKKMPMYYVAVDGDQWHVVVSVRTEAGEKAAAEYQLSDEELKVMVDKVDEELTPEQRSILVEALKTKGKIAAIKELRKMGAHSLKVQKMVVEKLQAEMAE